ncbi:DUF3618 domain-containing protein [Streptomyces sp. NPDC050625]|uniref:DUF3618 domain-containing protein n=1 Tax=Streptomyces sp. NPDC050625 TaxID=3154629 RepID=UPI0034374B33
MTDRTPQGAGAKGPEELRQQLDQTRSQPGDTAEGLTDKGDLKGRARARAADLRDKAGAMTVQLRSGAAQAGHTVQDRAAHAPRSVLLVGAAGAAVVAAGALRHRSHGHHGHHGRRGHH